VCCSVGVWSDYRGCSVLLSGVVGCSDYRRCSVLLSGGGVGQIIGGVVCCSVGCGLVRL